MKILEEIGKLITEHASAQVLKERLALAADQYSALERKLAGLQSENQDLQQKNQQLLAENQRLSSEISTYQNPSEALDEEKKRIMIVVAQHSDAISAQEVASQLNLHVLKVDQSLRELERDKFVHDHLYIGRPPDFSLAERGRKYLIANNLLSAVGNPTSRRSRFPRQVL